MSLANQFAAYSSWRARLAVYIGEFQSWLSHNELSDAQTDQRLLEQRLAGVGGKAGAGP